MQRGDNIDEHHQKNKPPTVIPFNEGDTSRVGGAAALATDGLAIARAKLLGTLLAAKRAVELGKKATAIGAFIQIGAIELIIVQKGTELSSHFLCTMAFAVQKLPFFADLNGKERPNRMSIRP